MAPEKLSFTSDEVPEYRFPAASEGVFASRKKRLHLDKRKIKSEGKGKGSQMLSSSWEQGDLLSADTRSSAGESTTSLEGGSRRVPRSKLILSLDELQQEITFVLSNRKNPRRLEECRALLELYRGSDWLLHSVMPEIRSNNAYGYTRSRVCRQADFFDLLVLTWAPYTISPIHNHPCERCFLMPIQGTLEECRYNVEEDKSMVGEADTIVMKPHKAYWIDDSHGWHCIKNESCNLGFSLHLYIPCYNRCKIVNPSDAKVCWVECYPANVKGSSLERKVIDLASCYFENVSNAPRRLAKIKGEDSIACLFKKNCPIDFTPGCKPVDDDRLLEAMHNTLEISTDRDNSFYLNHSFIRAHPLAVASEFLSSCINANMYEAEMFPLFALMETSILQHLSYFLGWHQYVEDDIMSKDSGKQATRISMKEEILASDGVQKSKESPLNTRRVLNASFHKLKERQSGPSLSDVGSRFDAIFTPGGSIANLMAMHVARDVMFPEIKQKGLASWSNHKELVVYSSEHAHESIPKALDLMGFGAENFVKVRTSSCGSMQPSDLRLKFEKTLAAGKIPFFVNCTAATTVFGAFDPFDEIYELCREFSVWMHVDGSLGASFLLPQEEPFRNLCKGMNFADSVSWNLHKLLGVPLQCSAFIVQHPGTLRSSYDIASLSDDLDGGSVGERSMQSGRKADALKAWCMWKKFGDIGMANRVRLIHTHTLEIGEMVTSFPMKYSCFDKGLSGLSHDIVDVKEVAIEGQPEDAHVGAFNLTSPPISCTCCFNWIPYDLRPQVASGGISSIDKQLDMVTLSIKREMRTTSVLNISCSKVESRPYLWRIPVFNPDICRDDIFVALCTLNRIGNALFPVGFFGLGKVQKVCMKLLNESDQISSSTSTSDHKLEDESSNVLTSACSRNDAFSHNSIVTTNCDSLVFE